MKRLKWLMLLLILSLVIAGVFFSCGDDDDDDDDSGAPVEDDDDAVDDDDATDDDDDSTDDDDDAVDDDDDAADDDDDDDDDDDTPGPFTIAHIYDSDDTEAQGFETFFEGLGHTVELYDVADLVAKAAPDFTDVDLFITDGNTDDESWDATNSAVLTDTGKPIIAIGHGAYVYEFLGQYISGGACMSGPGTDIIPEQTSHEVWTVPNDLGADGSNIQILASGTGIRLLHDDGTTPAGMEFLGKWPGVAKYEPVYYSLAVEDGIYGFWGWTTTAPQGYTQEGKDILENLLYYVMSNSKAK